MTEQITTFDDARDAGVQVIEDSGLVYAYRAADGAVTEAYRSVPAARNAARRGKWIAFGEFRAGDEPDGNPTVRRNARGVPIVKGAMYRDTRDGCIGTLIFVEYAGYFGDLDLADYSPDYVDPRDEQFNVAAGQGSISVFLDDLEAYDATEPS